MLVAFFAVYFLTAFVLPSWRVWRATGINPYVLPRDGSAYGFVGQVFRVLIAGTFLALAVHAWRPDWLAAAFPAFGYLSAAAWGRAGWALLVFSWLWTLLAQYHMQRSWRIGIDAGNATELIHGGLFRYSRNPIFLGILLTLLGLFLVLPNALTAVVLASAYVVIEVQVRLEEEFLLKQHGSAYVDYRRRTRRWI